MQDRKAFTMIELVFVIVVIGILSAIALPKFSNSADSAYHVRAKSTLVTVRNALATERQRRILRGDFTLITDLGLSSAGVAPGANTIAFDHFTIDAAGAYIPLFDYPVNACGSGTQRACWVRTDALNYTYRFSNASTGANGQADFLLGASRLDCTTTDTADCALLTD